MGKARTHPLSLMSREGIIEHVRALYLERGPSVLTFAALKAERIYFHLYSKGIRQSELIDALGARERYEAYKAAEFTIVTNTRVKRRWTWQRVLDEARVVMESQGFLPPAQWFQENQQGALVAAVYKFGKTWESLRDELGCFSTSNYVQSRSGVRWKSHPEASLSNFLYARGIEHKVGEKYPEEYARQSDFTYGYFDLHFLDVRERWIAVEIWGAKPNGHDEAEYARKRRRKEVFNRPSDTFLGIEYRDCYNERRLAGILLPFIGEIEPFVFDKPTDKHLYSTHWSNADELLEFCRDLAAKQPDGVFPSEGWLRKRGKYRGRDGAPYNTLSIYIKKWIGGVRKLRQLLGQQEHSTTLWDREKAIDAYRRFYETHGLTPGQAKSSGQGKRFARKQVLYAHSICHAVEVYAGGVRALNEALGIVIDRNRKWDRQKVIDGCKALHDRYGLSVGQVMNATPDHMKLFGITDADTQEAKKLYSAAQEHFGKVSEVHRELGFQTRDIRTITKERRRAVASGASGHGASPSRLPHN